MKAVHCRSLQKSFRAFLGVALTAARSRPLLRLALVVVAGMMAYNQALAQKIAFVSGDGAFFFSTQIYVMNADGSGRTQISERAGYAYEPQWSPDGTRILFTAAPFPDSPRNIFAVNADGSGQIKLRDDSAFNNTPRWSPDGKRILFLSGPADDQLDLYTMAADGSSPFRHTNIAGQGLSVVSAEWSRDGAKIAYTHGSVLPDAVRPSSIDVMDTSTGVSEHLYTGGFSLYNLQWSPNGKQIAVVADPGLFAIDVGSGEAVQLLGWFGRPDSHVSWSPDGKEIAYATSLPVSGGNAAFAIEVDGGGVTYLATDPFDTGFSRLEWSQDGAKIVAITRPSEDLDLGGKIYLLNADGSDPINLTPDGAVDWDFDAFGDFGGNVSPQISIGGVVMANLVPAVHTIAPLSIVSLFGAGFSAGSVFYPTLDVSGKVATILGGTCVEINGKRAPIFAMLPKQANVQAPSDLPLGPVTVSVIRNCGTAQEIRGNTVMVTVEKAAPVFFLYPPYATDGFIAARFNDGFAAVAPAGAIVDQQGPSKPARPGQSISLFGTGWGQTTEPQTTGKIATQGTSLIDGAGLTVTFDGVPLDPDRSIEYWGIAPGAAGVYQLAIRVPDNALPGNHQVVLTVYGKSTPAGPVIPTVAP